MSVRRYVFLSLCVCLSVSFCHIARLYVCLCVGLCLSISLLLCMFVRLCVCRSVRMFVRVCLLVCLSVCLSVCPHRTYRGIEIPSNYMHGNSPGSHAVC